MRKIIMIWSALFSNKSVASSSAAALAGLSALSVGFDPLPWIVSTVGTVYMLLSSEPNPEIHPSQARKKVLTNGIVSLVCGGLGGPWVAAWFGMYSPRLESPLLMAFLISAFWQLAVFKLWPKIEKGIDKWLDKKAEL